MSLRTTQQIDKLLVGQIFPRDPNQNFISTGQILVTDNQGKANWTSLSTLGVNYSQFTSLATGEGVIDADQPQTTLNFREGAGVNLQIISNSLYFATTAFTAIDISGGNSLLGSNSSNNIINPRLKFANGQYTKVRGDPGTNTIFIDVDYLSTTQGVPASYSRFIIKNNSTISEPPATESIVLDAVTSSSSLTLIGLDDLQIQVPNLVASRNVVFIGLSTITAAKFSTAYVRATAGLSTLQGEVDIITARQINTAGVQCNQFFPVSSQVWKTSTSFSAFLNYTFEPLHQELATSINATTNNYSTLSSYINLTNTYASILNNNFITVSNTTNITSTNLTTVSNLTITNSTIINSVYSTLSSQLSRTVGSISLSSLVLSTLLVSSIINVSSISVTGQTTLNSTNITGGLIADTVTSVFFGDGSHLTGISGGGGGISYSEFYPISTIAIQASTLTTSFFSTLSSYIRLSAGGISIVPPILSTTLLSTGLLTASNISVAVISTNYGFFSTISAGTIYAKFVGDGSGLTGIVGGSGGISIVPPILSTTLLSTGILTASNISVTTISTNAGSASSFYINKLTTSTVSALLGSFSSLSVSQVYISSLTVDNLTIGNDNGFINMGDVIAASISTILVTTGNLAAVNISTTTMSTTYGFFSTISAGTVYGKFVGDGSGLTGITGSSGGISIVPPVLSTTLLSTGLLTASNISTATISTNYGFFSTLSSGNIYGKHIGDGSGLTNLTTSSLSLSSGNISISTITLMDTTNNSSTGTIFARSSLLYFNSFIIGGASVWQSQLITGS